MKKRFLFLCLMILILIFGIVVNTFVKKEPAMWSTIKDKEWVSYESFAGTGLYFFEEENKQFCIMIIYGSGLPVIGHYVSEVKIISDNQIEISGPSNISDLDTINQKHKKHVIQLKDNTLIFNDMLYKPSETLGDYIETLKEK